MSQLLVAQRALTVPGWAKDALWRRAGAVPSLDLRFADSKSLVDATTGSNLVTFTRASSGTFVGSDGVLQTATSDVPRFDHNPTTGESLGLLVEEARSNLKTYSENLGLGFTQQNTTVTADSATAPDGAMTADLSVPNTTSASHASFATSITFTASTVYTYTIFAKPSGYSNLQLLFTSGFNNNNVWANFILNGAGSTGFQGAGVTASIQQFANGWYRCIITGTSGASATTGGPVIIVLDSDRNARDPAFSGDSTSGIYLWGAQVEAGAFPTSYIPTTTATVTRSADVCSISGSNFSAWFNATQSTIYSEAASSTGAAYSGYVYTIGASFNDSITHYRQSDSQPVARIRTASADEYGATGNEAIWTGTSVNRFALGVSTTSGRQSSNGTLSAVADDTSITFPAMSSMTIGALVGGSLALNGHLRRLTYWPTRLPNSTLQAVTQ